MESNSTPHRIVHVDINSYFATLLQQENPQLRGRPVAVVKGRGRTCVIAASKEAKTLGVQTGSRLIDARQICPQLIAVPADFDRALAATRRLHQLFTSLAPQIIIYSLDEAFIDLTDCQNLYPDLVTFSQQIQTQIKQELGEWVTCNVGISHNRLLSKMASESGPKGSITTINEENLDSVLATVTFDQVCGVGFRLAHKLRQLGVKHPYQIRLLDPTALQTLVGPFWTQELLKIAWGQEPHHLQLLDHPRPHMQSVGRSITGYALTDSETEIRQILLNLITEVTHKARQMQLAGRQVWVGLYGHGQAWGAHQTLTEYIDQTQSMFEIIYSQLYHNWHRPFPIIKFAVRLSLLKPTIDIPRPLFSPLARLEQTTAAIDSINSKYGLFTVKPASLLTHRLIRPEITGFLGDRQYYGLG